MKHLLVGIFLISFITLFAQSNRIQTLQGVPFKQSKKEIFTGIIASDSKAYYAVRVRGSKTFLEEYDKKLNQARSVELNLREGKRRKTYEFSTELDNKIYIFSSFKNKKLKKKFLFAQSVNKTTLQVNNDTKKIAEIDYSSKKWYSSSGVFLPYLSADSSKLLVQYALPYKKREPQKFGISVFDKSLKKLWSKDIKFPYGELFSVSSYKVDNEGNVHVLGIVYDEVRKSIRGGEANYRYEILSYYNNGKQQKKYPVKLEGKFLNAMQIAVGGANQNIVCAGFYSNKAGNGVEGTFLVKINKNSKQIVAKKFKKFDLDFITQNMTERQKKKAKKKASKGKGVELYQYYLDDLIVKPDGSVYLIGEQYYTRVVTHTTTDANGNMRTSTTTYYYFNDIIVVNFGVSGDVVWTEKIVKRQKTTNDGGQYSSYAYCMEGNNIYFVFNDHVDNLILNDEGDYSYFNTSRKRSALVMVEVGNRGKKKKQVIFQGKKEYRILTKPSSATQVSKNELILLGQSGKKNQLTKLTFKASRDKF
ncbi:MAG: hypothetical protein GY827_06530 [Cytophagales bacterium]|nr:hypothetical protein [Cytophagales bacterium]